jgi:hypothetical protein
MTRLTSVRPHVTVSCDHFAGAGKRYASPTAFTVAVKRQAAPAGRQGNDGWRSVLYEGGPLERVRKAYAAQFAPAADDIDEVRRCITSATLSDLLLLLCCAVPYRGAPQAACKAYCALLATLHRTSMTPSPHCT